VSTRRLSQLLGFIIVAGTVLVLPALAEAQRRGGHVRGGRGQSVVIVRSGYGWGYPGYWLYDQWGPYGPYGPYGRYPRGYVIDDFSASVKFSVDQKDAEVYVDGALAGEIDDFDGIFQELRLRPGSHEIVVFKEGFRSVRESLYIEPYQTRKLKFDLEPLRPGDPAELRPTPPPPGSQPEPQRPDYLRGRTPPRAEPPADREPPQAPARFGTLSLRVQPADAEVLIDGEKWTGPADSQRLNIRLAAGRHRVEVRKAGYVTYTEDVLIRGEATMSLNVSMTRSKN
jgi:hypothetical protein